MRDENEGKYRGGGGKARSEATGDHGLSKRSLRAKPRLRVELAGSEKVMIKNIPTKKCARTKFYPRSVCAVPGEYHISQC